MFRLKSKHLKCFGRSRLSVTLFTSEDKKLLNIPLWPTGADFMMLPDQVSCSRGNVPTLTESTICCGHMRMQPKVWMRTNAIFRLPALFHFTCLKKVKQFNISCSKCLDNKFTWCSFHSVLNCEDQMSWTEILHRLWVAPGYPKFKTTWFFKMQWKLR